MKFQQASENSHNLKLRCFLFLVFFLIFSYDSYLKIMEASEDKVNDGSRGRLLLVYQNVNALFASSHAVPVKSSLQRV